MNQTEISEKILAIAKSAGLSVEDVRALLSGNGHIPAELQEVLERVSDGVSVQCAED